MDKSKAVTAAAHKLARLIYTMLTKGEEYTDKGQDYYEERYRQRVVHQLSRRVEKLGLKLVPTEGRWGQALFFASPGFIMSPWPAPFASNSPARSIT